MSSKAIQIVPKLSEKTYGLAQIHNVYVFEVPAGINKHEVARAVAAQFEVTVENVNLTNIPGKTKRTISLSGKRMTNRNGQRADTRKAYVTLKKGDSLPVFAAVEEAEEQEQATQEKLDKAAAAQKAKEEKPTRRGLHRTKKEEK
ncbi:MAG TPA: 50S ribosomal protein L23 [Candidatus Saccharimonadales bacterium]|nr:50S ribosomal protein L23 [Candidatus Saccharimonadales bacterium]